MKGVQMRLAQRITAVFALVIVMLTGTLFVSMESYFRRTLTANIEMRAERLGQMLADVSRPHLMAYDYLTQQLLANGVVDGADVVYAIVFDKEGRVAGSGGQREVQGFALDDGPSDFALSVLLPENRRLQWARAGDLVPVIESIVPVRDPATGIRWGTVRLGVSLERVDHQLHMTRFFLLVFGTCGVLGALLAAMFLARRISRPLRHLVEATDQLESGNWDSTFHIDTGDEIGELATRFGAAAVSLDRQTRRLIEAKEELTEVNTGLEDQVRRRTAELTASREKYRLLVQGSPDAFVLLEGDRFIFVNPAFARIFEFDQPEVEEPTFSWEDIVHKNFHEKARKQFAQLAAAGQGFDADWTGQTRDGRTLDLEVRGRVVRYQGRDIIELVLTDVTEKKRLIQQILHNERLRAMGEMTALVAHHFNNTLAIIHGRAQLVQRRVTDEKLVESLRVIQGCVQKAGGMVRHLQDFFGEQIDLRFVEVDINALLQETVYYQERVWSSTRPAGSPPISVSLELTDVPPARGAAPLLQDAFGRVLANAVEAMPGGGEIVVSTSIERDQVIVKFRDTGCGMDAETIANAFDPFFTTKGPSCRGLGLSASQGILQRHEGQIHVVSERGQGTEVTIVLPVESAVSKVVPIRSEEEGTDPSLRSGS